MVRRLTCVISQVADGNISHNQHISITVILFSIFQHKVFIYSILQEYMKEDFGLSNLLRMLLGDSHLSVVFVPNDLRSGFGMNDAHKLGIISHSGVDERKLYFDFRCI